MSLTELLKNRSSKRVFTSEKVDPQLLQELFSAAQLSASNCNVQPWQTYVVSGDMRDQLEKELVAEILGGAEPTPDFDWLPRYKNHHRDRQFGSANALYTAMNIERTDKVERQKAMLKNWSFFNAPHAVFFCMERYLGIMGAVDMGIYAQTLSLLLEEQGISSCMQGALGQFPEPVREKLSIPDELGIIFGMSLGYASPTAKANNARTTRVDLNDSVVFVE